MQDRDVRRLERLQRVKTFLDNHIADFIPGGVVHATRTEVTGLLGKLNLARVGQIRTPLTKEEILERLFERFKAIARTSRSIGGDHPDFPAGDFRFPGDYTENTATTHADALLTLLEDKPTDTPAQLAEKAALRGRFTDYEMDPGFVAALRTDRDALDAANTGKHTDNQEGLEATAAIATLLNQANAAVTRLHGPIHNKYAAAPDKIHAWKQASRIESDPEPPEDPAPPTP